MGCTGLEPATFCLSSESIYGKELRKKVVGFHLLVEIDIKRKIFLNDKIPIIKKDEQFAKVALLKEAQYLQKELFSKLDIKSVKIYNLRQSILQDAVQGKLTKHWRKENPQLVSENNHASVLLKK